MKPELVDLEEIFKENSSIFLKEKKPELPLIKKPQKIDYKFSYNSLFNFLGLCIVIIGLYFLNNNQHHFALTLFFYNYKYIKV